MENSQSLGNRKEKKKLKRGVKVTIAAICGSVALILFAFLFIFYGAEKISGNDVYNAFFHYNSDNFNETIVRDIRLPRLFADIIIGISLAISGAVMQGTTKNPIADSGIMGISSGSTFAVVLIVVFLPNVTRLERIGISCLGAAIVTALIYGLALIGKHRMSADRMVLSGMAISTLFSSVTTAIILQQGISSQMMRYTAGSSANTIWADLNVAWPFFLGGFVLSLAISRSLTVLNLDENVSKGLGMNTLLVKLLSTIVVLVLSAISVVIIGPVGYVGLMIPHIVRKFVGTDYRYVLPCSAIYGSLLVVIADLLARVILAPFEFPIGLILTIIGVPFFIYTSRNTKQGALGE